MLQLILSILLVKSWFVVNIMTQLWHTPSYQPSIIKTGITFQTTWTLLKCNSGLMSLHSTPLTGRAIKPQRQGHIGGPIAQP